MISEISNYLPFIFALLFLGIVLGIYFSTKSEEKADVLRSRIQAAKTHSVQHGPADSVTVFEAENEHLLEVRLDEFFKDLSKKRGVSTGFIQKLTAGISAGSALLAVVISILASVFLLKALLSFDISDAAMYGVPVGLMVTVSFFKKYQAKREKEFLTQFPLAFDVVSRGLKAGATVEKTFVTVAEQLDGTVGKEFDRINQEVEFGVPFEEALVNAAERIQIDDFSFFSIALIIQKKAGGSLSDLITNISSFLRKRQELRLKVKALSAEAKATGGIVGSMPILILVVMYFINPETIDILRNDPAGRKLSVFLVCFMLTGIWIIRRMINIKV